MKNFFKFLGVIAMVAVIGFGMAACDDGKTDKKDDNKNNNGGGGNTNLLIRIRADQPDDMTLDVKVTAADGTETTEKGIAKGTEKTIALSVGEFGLEGTATADFEGTSTEYTGTTTFKIEEGAENPVRYEFYKSGSRGTWIRY